MSTGGVFQVVTNDGIQDKLIMQTDKLREIIKTIGCRRLVELRKKFPGVSDKELVKTHDSWIPSLQAIERSHIIYVHNTFKPFVSLAFEYRKTGPTGGSTPVLGNSMTFNMPIFGEFVNDAVVNLKLTGLRAIQPQDKVRYVEMIGHRLFKKTTLKLSGQELDSYGSEKYNIHWQYKVPPGKETGYLRNIGQEIPREGLLTADPAVDEVREYRYFGDGPQTFKTTQSTLELWIPLLFWFKDIHNSLPGFLFPTNQTEVVIDLETAANLVAYSNYSGTTGDVFNAPTIRDCWLYANNIYLLPEIHKIFMSKFGFQLIRVSRNQQNVVLTASSGSILLHDLKWPIETIYVAFRPISNLANSRKWHRNSIVDEIQVKEAVVTGVATIQVNNAVYYNEKQVVSTLELQAGTIQMFPALPPAFYNSYLPYQFGESLKTPKDLGWFMFNFNVNPGVYQPSGHFNASQERELYLLYNSDINSSNQYHIRSDNPVECIIHAECINFLIVDDNTAVLRFT